MASRHPKMPVAPVSWPERRGLIGARLLRGRRAWPSRSSEPTVEIRLSIRSRFEEIDLVDGVAAAALSHLGVDEDDRDRLVLAIREAVANAIVHGNEMEERRPVEVRLQLDEVLVVEIRDCGRGFDPEALPDPLAPDNLLKRNGRGILLMRSFMDEVSFGFPDGGTVVTLRKALARA